MQYIEPMAKLIENFRSLPGIGSKTAVRLAYHVLDMDKEKAKALAEAIKWALHLSTEEREKIGAAGIKNVKEHFTKQIMCDKTIEVYKELINL